MSVHLVPEDVSEDTLDETPHRALQLLRGMGSSGAIRDILAEHGFSDADQDRGWVLLKAEADYAPDDASTGVNKPATAAIRALDAFEHKAVRIIRATLPIHFPTQAKKVLAGLDVQGGAGAVLTVTTLLGRLDALEKSKSKEDHAALAHLALRGIGVDKRKELRGVLKIAESAPPAASDAKLKAKADAAHHAALVALRAWFTEWSEICHVSITRRDHLIRLGLAKRHAKPEEEPPPAKG